MEMEGRGAEPLPPSEVQIVVKFTTKLPEPYRVDGAPMTVPGSLKRKGLSKVVNRLLQAEELRPFDFVVEGKLLRTSLHEHFVRRGLSVEGVVEIEYIPVILPPRTKETAVHDDWVSAVHGKNSTLLTASYDGIVKGWTNDLRCLWSLGAHEHPITSVISVPGSNPEMFLTASQDFHVKAWILNQETAAPPIACATLKGHSHSVCDVGVSPDGDRCCSVGWGEEMHIWPCGDALLDASPDEPLDPPKRQKRDAEANPAVKTISPLGHLSGHRGCISGVIWPRKSSLLTSGWDHTLRKWSVQTGQSSESLNRSRAILCLTTPPTNAAVVAFGSTDAILRLWDTRSADDGICVSPYRSHSNWIVSVAWSPLSDFHLATASHDGSVRVWDIRGCVPVVTCASLGDKCLAVDWSGEWAVASGGTDCAVHLHRVDASVVVEI